VCHTVSWKKLLVAAVRAVVDLLVVVVVYLGRLGLLLVLGRACVFRGGLRRGWHGQHCLPLHVYGGDGSIREMSDMFVRERCDYIQACIEFGTSMIYGYSEKK
jgi:hypothetical protein